MLDPLEPLYLPQLSEFVNLKDLKHSELTVNPVSDMSDIYFLFCFSLLHIFLLKSQKKQDKYRQFAPKA